MDYVLEKDKIRYRYSGDISQAIEDLFIPTDPKSARYVIARIAGVPAHIIRFNPRKPNDITHRPGPGRAVVKHQTFDEAIGHYLRDFVDSSIEYRRKK